MSVIWGFYVSSVVLIFMGFFCVVVIRVMSCIGMVFFVVILMSVVILVIFVSIVVLMS